jgi:hypothetical protein
VRLRLGHGLTTHAKPVGDELRPKSGSRTWRRGRNHRRAAPRERGRKGVPLNGGRGARVDDCGTLPLTSTGAAPSFRDADRLCARVSSALQQPQEQVALTGRFGTLAYVITGAFLTVPPETSGSDDNRREEFIERARLGLALDTADVARRYPSPTRLASRSAWPGPAREKELSEHVLLVWMPAQRRQGPERPVTTPPSLAGWPPQSTAAPSRCACAWCERG